ncbi:MAG: aminotransferase class V-fold PLP-dependent enzyme [Desulfarculaceae bacterium]|nr:aminotransferase class V-fold PLP-dependent enzyme [Desulfarculaceae bacterium]MCF8070771.1 aminotransferase class V-fold PLP-dependent enzyme [Desulfarculaceae bacterium]MCF8102208.1 aminotransferase class V-fold PLP-dependent enzyme [Desulfarculaceae bacterium]MCF8116993.1 aminotransferase class V-fold PLP-dependent enzyme [Desulfarculaceae bacterium]
MIYLDNAATSFPKPASCFREALDAYLAAGASPGRGGYDAAVAAEHQVIAVRRAMAAYVGAPDYVTCFAANATDALNTLLQGLVRPGDHVISTRLEHNSVLRPLHHLREAGIISFDLAPFNAYGVVEPRALEALFQPNTRLVMLNHASNVLGTLQPAAEIGAICAERGVPLLLDASQSAGAAPIDLLAWKVSALAFTGHKSLMGPPGIGGLVLDPALEVRPSRWGGTGVDSESVLHSREYPERLEAGTINLLGIMTLGRCLERLATPEAAEAAGREAMLHARLVEGLAALEGVTVHCPGSGAGRIPVVSFNLEGWPPHDVGMVLDGDYEIAVRTGLHCAPLLHQDLGHGAAGSVRVSLGPFNTAPDVEALLAALSEMLGQS